MTKVWDGTMKWLAEEAPQDFVEWLREGSICIAELSPHLNARSIHADLLYRVQYEDQPYLLHIEFQKRSARNMPLRLFEYNLLATRKYKLPVYSVVIYLKKDRPVVEAPYILFLPWGRRIFHFDYHTIKLWEIPTESIFRSGLDGLLPLVPLTREGLRRESLERVIERLSPPGEEPKINQLALTYTLAELQYTEEEDFSWLKRSFPMGDILDDMIKESRVYKEWTQDERAKGVKEGVKKGIEQGAQQMFVSAVQTRFASLTSLAQERGALLKTPEQLQRLLTQVLQAQSEEEARRFLLAASNRQTEK